MNGKKSPKRGTLFRLGMGSLLVTLGAAGIGCEQRDTGTAGAEVRKGSEGAAQPQKPPEGQQPGTMAEPIRDVSIIIVTTDRPSLLNRQVDLVGAEVQKVSNDRLFWIGPTPDSAVPVYLDDQARAAMQQAQQKIVKGDKVALVGELRQTPSMQDIQQLWNMPALDAEQINRFQVYLHARRILVGQEGAKPGQQGTQPQGGGR